MACWIGVASADHVRDAVPGGFAQLGHGRHDVVESLKRGDWLVYYASRERMGKGALIQAFIAIGRVLSDAPYHAVQAMDFNPFRVDVAYVPNAQPARTDPAAAEWAGPNQGSPRQLGAAGARPETKDFD